MITMSNCYLSVCGDRLFGRLGGGRAGGGIEPARPAAVLAALQEKGRERLENGVRAGARGRHGRHGQLQLHQLRVVQDLRQDGGAQTQLLEPATGIWVELVLLKG
jgi:hypothetical protein